MHTRETPTTRAQCEALDARDPLAPLREQFALPEGLLYLDGNSLGALPRATAPRLAHAVTDEWGRGLISSWNDAGWIALPRRVGAKIARLVGAGPDDVLAADSTSVNLFKVLAAALRIAHERDPARTVLVSERQNFPTDLYIAQGLADLLGPHGAARYTLRLVDDARALDAAVRDDTAVVLLTQVDYRSGALHDMHAVSSLAHARGALIVWDLAHSAGALPVDLARDGADFAVGCGYKYLNGGPGAPAFVWVSPEIRERCWQPLAGWLGHRAPFAFDPTYEPADGITRYQCGTPAVLAMTALECGVDTVLAAEPLGGMRALREKSLVLQEIFRARVEATCAPYELALASPREPTQRGSQVSFRAGPSLAHGYPVMRALIARGVIGDFRAPDVLRFGFTPLYLRHTDAFDAATVLAEVLATRAWDVPAFHQKAAVT